MISASTIATTLDPTRLLTAAGLQPDPWQRELLLNPWKRALLNITRQEGKSTAAAALALHQAMLPESLVLVLSPSQRQSKELFAKVWRFFQQSGGPIAVEKKSELRVRFMNGSRVVALPGKEETIRGFSGVDLLIVDEAARVMDDLYRSVRPMLAVSGGRIIAPSTPWGKRGWWYEAWHSTDEWRRVKVTAEECPRISEAFLEEERRALGEWWFRQEYLCEFMDTVDQLYRTEDIERAFSADVAPLFDDTDIEPLIL